MQKKLTRNEKDGAFAGVCEGLGEYLNIDPIFIRLAFIIAVISFGVGAGIYLILWILMPEKMPEQ